MEFNKESVIAFVRLFCALISSGAAMFGFAMDADIMFTAAMSLIALVVLIWNWWKNNNVTKAAQEAQEYLKVIKKADGVDRSDEDEAKG